MSEEASTTRERRVYVKSYLKSHPIWENDDFWYVDRTFPTILSVALGV
jgi:hypothetical protein